MKKILLSGLLLVSISATSQIKVENTEKTELIGEVKQFGTSYEKITKSHNVCFLTYRDEKFATIDNYKHFSFSESDLDTIYSLFSDFTDKKKGDSKTVTLETGDVLLINYNMTMGTMYAEIFHTDTSGVTGKLRWLTQKQLKSLFGKN